MLAHGENRHRHAAASKNNENHDLVEVVKGIVDQFRETLPLLGLNLTGHAENPCGLLFLAESASDTALPMGLLTGAFAG
jgi:hypothetical protein